MNIKTVFEAKTIFEGKCPECGRHQTSNRSDDVDTQCSECFRKENAIRDANEKYALENVLLGAVVTGIEYNGDIDALRLMNKDGRPILITIDYDSEYAMAYQAKLKWS